MLKLYLNEGDQELEGSASIAYLQEMEDSVLSKSKRDSESSLSFRDKTSKDVPVVRQAASPYF